MWVLSIGLVVSLQGLLGLGWGEGGELSGVSAFSPTGQVRLGGRGQAMRPLLTSRMFMKASPSSRLVSGPGRCSQSSLRK